MRDTSPSITIVETFTQDIGLESHPIADEAVCCLCGAVRLYLRAQRAAADGVVERPPGQAATQRD
jgi:hypothetical protein